jgi:hypothetical protein
MTGPVPPMPSPSPPKEGDTLIFKGGEFGRASSWEIGGAIAQEIMDDSPDVIRDGDGDSGINWSRINWSTVMQCLAWAASAIGCAVYFAGGE